MNAAQLSELLRRAKRPGRSVLDAMDARNMGLAPALGALLAVADASVLVLGVYPWGVATLALVAHLAASVTLAVAGRRYGASEEPRHLLAQRALTGFFGASCLCAAVLLRQTRLAGGQDLAFALMLATTVMAFELRPAAAGVFCVLAAAVQASVLSAVDGPTAQPALGAAALAAAAFCVSVARFAAAVAHRRELARLGHELELARRVVTLEVPRVNVAADAAAAEPAGPQVAEGPADPHLGPGQTTFDFGDALAAADAAPKDSAAPQGSEAPKDGVPAAGNEDLSNN